MNRKKMLAYVTGSVVEELQRRNEYLVAENGILRSQLHVRIRLNNTERIRLAAIGKRLGRKALAEVAQIVSPETILAWHRRLVARTFGGTMGREGGARSTIPEELVAMVAEENRT